MEGLQHNQQYDWKSASDMYGGMCKEGQIILTGWKTNTETNRVIAYTLEREDGILEKYVRAWDIDSHPVWDYIYTR